MGGEFHGNAEPLFPAGTAGYQGDGADDLGGFLQERELFSEAKWLKTNNRDSAELALVGGGSQNRCK